MNNNKVFYFQRNTNLVYLFSNLSKIKLDIIYIYYASFNKIYLVTLVILFL